MKKIFRKRNILIVGVFTLCVSLLLYTFLDGFGGIDTFRTTQDKLPDSVEVDLTGLRQLQASGGSVPRFSDLSKRLSHIKEKKIIFDVMNEFHGYVNGVPSNFLGYHLDKPGPRHIPRRLLITGTTKLCPELLVSEEDEAKKYNFGYKNVSIGSKFMAPDANVDEFVNFFDTLDENTWVHFHCVQGKGRTSMALIMFDTMKNAPRVALEDIMKRQYLLGSVNLYDTAIWKKASYTTKMLEDRLNFITDFYRFICQRKAGGIQLWSDWHKQQS